jgi:type I restriction enzyme S subunit
VNGELPKDWVWTSLENCIDILDSKRNPINAEERQERIQNKNESDLYPYYGATGQVGWIDGYIFDEELILLGEDGAPFLDFSKDKSYLIKGKTWVNNHAHVLRAVGNIANNRYICHYLNIFDYRNYITGTTRYKLNQSQMRKIPIPLPPLTEQQRIVNKIEELFTNLDKGVQSLEEVKSKLKIYRQAILKHAMEGKLTEKWREENKNFNKNDLNLQDIENLEEAYYSTELIIENIPSNWSLVKVEKIADFFKGQRSPKNYYVEESHPEARPYIRIQDFKTKKASMYTKADWCLKCQKIDTLLATDGAIGSSDFGWEGVLTHHILCIRPKVEYILPYLLYLLININKNYFYKNKTGVCSPTLRQQYVRKLIIPLPPIEEQQEIVNRIEKLFSLADHIEETVNSKLEESKTLRQSILKKAFEGKLVPQDPNDESAEILLEKIKMEKSNKGKSIQEKLVQ